MTLRSGTGSHQSAVAIKSVQAVLIFAAVVTLLCESTFTKENSINFRMPVRVLAPETGPLPDLNSSNLRVWVNDQPVSIFTVSASRDQRSHTIGPPRHFFISFHITRIDREIESTLSHLLTEMLSENDTLHILSPLKIYRYNVTPNKGALLNEILSVLETDCTRYLNSLALQEKNIEHDIREIFSQVDNFPSSFYAGYLLNRFKNTYQKDISEYRDRCLDVPLDQFSKICDLVPPQTAENHIIHFQQQKATAFLEKTTGMFKSQGTSGYFHFFSELVRYNQAIMAPDPSLLESIRHRIFSRNLQYKVVYFRNGGENENRFLDSLKKLCQETGGLFSIVRSPPGIVQAIKNHRYQQFEISFQLKDLTQDIHVQISTPLPGIELLYQDRFPVRELKEQLPREDPKKIQISQAIIDPDRISFAVDTYQIDPIKKIALFKVEIEIFDLQKNRLFQTENILRASGAKTTMTVTIPLSREKTFNLIITATDLIGNTSTRLESSITPGTKFPVKIKTPGAGELPESE